MCERGYAPLCTRHVSARSRESLNSHTTHVTREIDCWAPGTGHGVSLTARSTTPGPPGLGSLLIRTGGQGEPLRRRTRSRSGLERLHSAGGGASHVGNSLWIMDGDDGGTELRAAGRQQPAAHVRSHGHRRGGVPFLSFPFLAAAPAMPSACSSVSVACEIIQSPAGQQPCCCSWTGLLLFFAWLPALAALRFSNC